MLKFFNVFTFLSSVTKDTIYFKSFFYNYMYKTPYYTKCIFFVTKNTIFIKDISVTKIFTCLLLFQKLWYFDMLCCMMQCRFSGVFIGSAWPQESASREGGGWRTVQDRQAVRTDVWTRLQDLSLHGNNRPSH